jgi:hypothetical protein
MAPEIRYKMMAKKASERMRYTEIGGTGEKDPTKGRAILAWRPRRPFWLIDV